MTIVEFLLARLDDDERWTRSNLNIHSVVLNSPGSGPWLLADFDAKRRVIALHNLVTEDYTGQWWATPRADDPQHYVTTGCDNCRSAGVDGEEYLDGGPCETLRLLAMPYSGHRDFDPSWLVGDEETE